MFVPQKDLNLLEVKFLFDDSGGCILKLGENFWHRYTDMKKAFNDYYKYLVFGFNKFKYNDRKIYEWEDIDEYNVIWRINNEVRWFSYTEMIVMAKKDFKTFWSPEQEKFVKYIKKYQIGVDKEGF